MAIDEIIASPERGRALGLAARREAQRHGWDRRARSILERLGLRTGPASATTGRP
jgi:hypothetical protein